MTRMFVDFATQMEAKNDAPSCEVDRLRELVDWLQYEIEIGKVSQCQESNVEEEYAIADGKWRYEGGLWKRSLLRPSSVQKQHEYGYAHYAPSAPEFVNIAPRFALDLGLRRSQCIHHRRLGRRLERGCWCQIVHAIRISQP